MFLIYFIVIVPTLYLRHELYLITSTCQTLNLCKELYPYQLRLIKWIINNKIQRKSVKVQDVVQGQIREFIENTS